MMIFWLTCLVGYPRTSAPEPKYHPDRKPNEPWMSYWEDEDKRPFVTDTVIVENEQKIKEYEGYYKKAIVYNEWQKEQKAFSTLCWNTAHDNFPNLGRYKYPIYLPSYNNNYDAITNECTIWQTQIQQASAKLRNVFVKALLWC